MILSSAIQAHVYSEAVDMRKSIDALAQIVSRCMGMNPLSGQVFVFIGRRRDKAKGPPWVLGAVQAPGARAFHRPRAAVG